MIRSLSDHRKFVARTRAENLKGNPSNVVHNLERFLDRAGHRRFSDGAVAAPMADIGPRFINYRYWAIGADGSLLEPVEAITLECLQGLAKSDARNCGILAGWIETADGVPVEKWTRH